MGVADHRGDEAVFNGDGHREIDAGVFDNGIARKGSVDFRVCLGGARCGQENEIVYSHLGGSCSLGGGIQILSQLGERSGIDFDCEIEVRDLGFAGQETLGNRAAHSGERCLRVCIRERHLNAGCCRSGAAHCRGCGGDIRCNNAASRTCALNSGKIHSAFEGDFLGKRGGFDTGAIGRGCGFWLGCRRSGGSGS